VLIHNLVCICVVKVGLLGEKVRLYQWKNLNRVKWSMNKAGLIKNRPLAWYKVCLFTYVNKYYMCNL
jgi:hypothetical protein